MTTTSAPDERPSVAMTDEAYGALRASAALWTGTSVLITNQHGQVLIQRVSYRPTCLLPGGAVDKGESPAQGAPREVKEELGVTANVTRGLAVDWVSPASRTTAPALKFPGEILHVFDGGVWDEDQIAAIRPAPGEIEAVEFAEPADLPALMSPGDARRTLSALRARIAGTGPALLEDGLPIAPTVLDRVGALRTARDRHHFITDCKTGEVALGKDETGAVIVRRLNGETPHWAQSVGTGGGTSTFNVSVAVQLIARGA